VNKVEAIKREKDGLDVLPALRAYAAAATPVEEIPGDELVRMKWYGVFHRQLTPGFFMMRLRTDGGRLTSEQVEAIAAICREHGRGEADITTRQNIQLRWLTLDEIPGIWERLAAVGMASAQTGMDNVRNYVSCPLAGLDAEELIDPTPLVQAIARAHLGLKDFSNLPRKFNLSITGCKEDCGQAQTQDLAFVPATRNVNGRPAVGFNVLVGGALGGTSPRLAEPLDVFVLPDQVAALFTAVLRVYRDHGPREQRTKARLKLLVDEWGMPKVREEVEREMRIPLLRPGTDARTTFGGDHLGVHAQRDPDVHYIGLHVPVGRITADQLEGLARLARIYGNNEVRLTVGQNAIITGVKGSALPRLMREPLLRQLRPDPPAVWRNLVACTGKDYCHFSLIDTKKRAIELAMELESRGVAVPDGTRINISGCVHACGKHHIANIGLQGANVRVGDDVIEAADIYEGGSLGHTGQLALRTTEKVPMSDMADAITTILARQSTEKIDQKPLMEPALAAVAGDQR
jgi:ferredoxin-nitrite reductase